MRVDPDQLRSLAALMDDVGTGMRALAATTASGVLGAAMPDSPLASTGASCAQAVTDAMAAVAGRFTEVAEIARGNAARFEMSEEEFTARIQAIGTDS